MEGDKAMAYRSSLFVLVVIAGAAPAAEHETANFVVTAASFQIAKQVAVQAEHHRKELARLWLGRELPPWDTPCHIHVTVNLEGPSGATTFEFGQGKVLSQKIHIAG